MRKPSKNPQKLGPLSQLAGLRELFLPAHTWSPVSDVKASYSAWTRTHRTCSNVPTKRFLHPSAAFLIASDSHVPILASASCGRPRSRRRGRSLPGPELYAFTTTVLFLDLSL